MEIALGVICLIALLIAWEAVKYSSQKKKINEGINRQNNVRSSKQKEATKHRAKAAKNKVSNKNESGGSDKKKKKSVKKEDK